MIKVKDGYAKLIGTTYSGSVSRVLLSNGGDHILGNSNGNIPLNNGTVNTNLNADMLDGLHIHAGRNNEVNKIVRTDANGFLQTGWINTTSGNIGTGAINKIYCSNDDYIRYKTPANFFPTLANSGNDISITVAGQNRTLTVGYATNADKVDGYHASKFPYINDSSIWKVYGNSAAAALADNTAGLSAWAFGETRNSGRTYLGILKPSTATCGISVDGTIAIFGQGDTHLGIASDYSSANLQVFGGNADKIVWRKKIAFADGTGVSGTWDINISGNAASATKSEYSRSLLGRSTSGSDYDTNRANLVFAEWDTMHDNRWYLKATGCECRVAYANSAKNAANADTVDGVHLSGIFTAFGNNAHNITATIGGVTKSFLVNWAADSDKLDGYHASSSNKPWGTIPVITTEGFMDIGKDLEFHYDNTTGSDYSTALMCQGNYNNIVYLPSVSGTLALTSDIPNPTNYYWANVKISTSPSITTSPTVSNLTATNSIKMGKIYLQNNSEINCASGLYLNFKNSANVNLCNSGGNVFLCHGKGSVGIGTISPAYKLDVNGDTRMTSITLKTIAGTYYKQPICLACGYAYDGPDSNGWRNQSISCNIRAEISMLDSNGKYVVWFPEIIESNYDRQQMSLQLTGCAHGQSRDGTVKAVGTLTRYGTSLAINVWTSDDDSINPSSFYFAIWSWQ